MIQVTMTCFTMSMSRSAVGSDSFWWIHAMHMTSIPILKAIPWTVAHVQIWKLQIFKASRNFEKSVLLKLFWGQEMCWFCHADGIITSNPWRRIRCRWVSGFHKALSQESGQKFHPWTPCNVYYFAEKWKEYYFYWRVYKGFLRVIGRCGNCCYMASPMARIHWTRWTHKRFTLAVGSFGELTKQRALGESCYGPWQILPGLMAWNFMLKRDGPFCGGNLSWALLAVLCFLA